MEDPSIGHRFISPERASGIFAMQVDILPKVRDEVASLSGGSIGLLSAIMVTMGEKISEEPDVEVSPKFIRETLGVPEDSADLGEWRENFWDEYKSRHEKP